jgi:hypothetical protein
MNDRFLFWQRWLVMLGLIIVAFGVFMAIFNQTAIFDLLDTGNSWTGRRRSIDNAAKTNASI